MPPAQRSSSQDACPGALAVHRAEDGNLARVRIPGGILPTTRLAVLADAAARLGDAYLELTSRGNVQLRALAPGAEVELARLLREIGLLPSESHERVRNIAASPLTGRDGSGHIDVRPLVAELDRGLCADPALAELSGRFLFALDDGRHDVSGLAADVTLLAVSPDTVALILAGHDTGLRTGSADATGLALAAAATFLAHRDPRSPAWRLAELTAAARDSMVARLAATAGVWTDEPRPTGPTHRPPVGVLAQRDGLVAVCAGVALGRLDPAQIDTLIRAAAERSREVVITPWRTVLVPDLPPPVVAGAQSSLAAAGLLTDPHSPLVRVSACAGKPRCGRALADVRADALATVPAAGTPAGPLAVHWVGCERACGRPAGRHVQVLAMQDGYQVSLDGEVRAHVAPGADLVHAVTTARGDTAPGEPVRGDTVRGGAKVGRDGAGDGVG